MAAPPPTWNSAQYLRFQHDRTLPCRDLAHRIDLEAPESVVDLGCGTGTSTEVIAERWPIARLVGVDSSAEMLEGARASRTPAEWVLADLRSWNPPEPFDLVFSNAALQWLPDHAQLLPRLLGWVRPGGALAFQVPARGDPPAAWVTAIDTLRRRDRWRETAAADEAASNVLELSAYYDILSPRVARIELWDTEYHHVLDGPSAVVEWVKGTALRRWLPRLEARGEQTEFLTELTREMERLYPPQPDGKVIFPFLRRFVIAYR